MLEPLTARCGKRVKVLSGISALCVDDGHWYFKFMCSPRPSILLFSLTAVLSWVTDPCNEATKDLLVASAMFMSVQHLNCGEISSKNEYVVLSNQCPEKHLCDSSCIRASGEVIAYANEFCTDHRQRANGLERLRL